MKTLRTLANEINSAASLHPRMQTFQGIRQRLHGLSRVKTRHIFSRQTTFDYYAFHSGGRNELQYNIGFEEEGQWFRYGVAFSLEPSQSLPRPLVLKPKIDRFNAYVRKNATALEDLRFWFYDPRRNPGKSPYLPMAPIADDLIDPPNFLFFGHLVPRAQVDPAAVVFLFDRLLNLYEYVEGKASAPPVAMSLKKGFRFNAGCSLKLEQTSANWKGGMKSVDLRHNRLQQALFDILSAQHGPDNVGTENDSGRRSRVDLVVHKDRKYHYYEIKTGPCVRSCLRDAVSQLLEYAYWPGGQEAERLVVVSENPLTPDARRYVEALRKRFSLPIFYQHLNLRSKTLGSLQ